MFERKGIPELIFNGPVFSTESSIVRHMPTWAYGAKNTFLNNVFVSKWILCCVGASALCL